MRFRRLLKCQNSSSLPPVRHTRHGFLDLAYQAGKGQATQQEVRTVLVLANLLESSLPWNGKQTEEIDRRIKMP
jgi:hypothetical protein